MDEAAGTRSDYDVLLGMGFSPLLVRKALIVTGKSGLNPAIDWLSEHVNDSDPTEEELKVLESSHEGTVSDKANDHHKQEETPVRTQEEIEEEAARYQEILAKKREQREKEEELEKFRAEKERRKMGREMQNLRQKIKEESIYRAVDDRRKEKQEDTEYLRKIKLQMEIENKSRFGAPAEEKESIPQEKIVAHAQEPSPDTLGMSRIQVIIPNSPRLLKTFPSTSPLSEVYDFVHEETGQANFDLVPLVRIEGYDPKLKDKSLINLGIARGTSLILTPWS